MKLCEMAPGIPCKCRSAGAAYQAASGGAEARASAGGALPAQAAREIPADADHESRQTVFLMEHYHDHSEEGDAHADCRAV